MNPHQHTLVPYDISNPEKWYCSYPGGCFAEFWLDGAVFELREEAYQKGFQDARSPRAMLRRGLFRIHQWARHYIRHCLASLRRSGIMRA